jgi:hypothetical protein
MNIKTDGIGSYESNYHTITTTQYCLYFMFLDIHFSNLIFNLKKLHYEQTVYIEYSDLDRVRFNKSIRESDLIFI